MTGTMNELWDRVNRVSDEVYPGWRNVELLYWAVALAGEVGEFCNATKKRNEGGHRAAGITTDLLAEELADVYLQKTAVSLGVDKAALAAAVGAKLGKIKQRDQNRPQG